MLLVCLVLFIVVVQSTVPEFAANYTDLLEFFDGKLKGDNMLEDFGVAGLAVTVLHKGSIIFFKGYGYQDHNEEIPVTPNTMFGIASISKTFCAVASLNAFTSEDAETSVNEFCPHDHKIGPYVVGNYISANGRPEERSNEDVTLSNLYTHTGGFDEPLYYFHKGGTLKSDIESHMPHRIREPSIVSTYSNYGIAYLALLLEQKHGLEYSDILQTKLFNPLHFNSTVYGWENAKDHPNLCQPSYTSGSGDDRKWNKMPLNYQDMSCRPAGAIYSSSLDLSRWANAILTGDPNIFKRSGSYNELFSKRFELSPAFSSYMNTVFYTIPVGDIPWDIHAGDLPPYHGEMWFQRDNDLAVIILFSSTGSSFRGNLRELFTYRFFHSCVTLGGEIDEEDGICYRKYDLTGTWERPGKREAWVKNYQKMTGCYMYWRYSHTGWSKLISMLMYYHSDPSLYFCLEVGDHGYLRISGAEKIIFLENIFSNESDSKSDFLIGEIIDDGKVRISVSRGGILPNMYFLNDGDERRYWISGTIFTTFEFLGDEWAGSWLIFQEVFITLIHILVSLFLCLCCIIFCCPVCCNMFCKCRRCIEERKGGRGRGRRDDKKEKGYSKMTESEDSEKEDIELQNSSKHDDEFDDLTNPKDNNQWLEEGGGEISLAVDSESSGEDENVYILELQQQMTKKGRKKGQKTCCVMFCYISFLTLIFLFAALSTLFNTFHYLFVYVIVTTIYYATLELNTTFLNFAVSMPIFSIIFIFCCIITLGLMYAFFIAVACLTATVNWKKIRWYVWMQLFLFIPIMVVVVFGNVSYFVTVSEYNTFVYK